MEDHARGGGRSGKIEVSIVRVYEDPGRSDSEHRVLVDRLWPRGVKKEVLDVDEWDKDVAPSANLRRWYGHEPSRFPEFERRYRVELATPPAGEEIDRLQRLAAGGERLVLLTATKDVPRSGAAVLQSVLEGGVRP